MYASDMGYAWGKRHEPVCETCTVVCDLAHHFPTLSFFPTLSDHGGCFQVHQMSGMHRGYHEIPKHVRVQIWTLVINPRK